MSNSVMLYDVQRLPRITAGYKITFCNTPEQDVTVTINLSPAGTTYLTPSTLSPTIRPRVRRTATYMFGRHSTATHTHTHTHPHPSQILHSIITDMATMRNSEVTPGKFLDFLTLKMAALCPFEMSATVYQTARRNIPGDLSLKQQLCDNLKFSKFLTSRTSRLIRRHK